MKGEPGLPGAKGERGALGLPGRYIKITAGSYLCYTFLNLVLDYLEKKDVMV